MNRLKNIKHYQDVLKSKISKSMHRQSSPSRKICQIHRDNRELVYLVYKTLSCKQLNCKNTVPKENRTIWDSHDYYFAPRRFLKEDYAGIFTTKKDAEQVAQCLNNIFLNVKDPNYKLYEYRVYGINLDENNDKKLYMIIGTWEQIRKLPLEELKYDVLVGITSTYKNACDVKKQDERQFGTFGAFDPYFNYKRGIKRYYLNDVMPTMNLDDYDVEKHKERMKIITDELVKYPQKKKMKDVLENIELLKHAPPSRVLPKGGLEYQKMVNDPEFRKRWAKYDKKIQPL